MDTQILLFLKLHEIWSQSQNFAEREKSGEIISWQKLMEKIRGPSGESGEGNKDCTLGSSHIMKHEGKDPDFHQNYSHNTVAVSI